MSTKCPWGSLPTRALTAYAIENKRFWVRVRRGRKVSFTDVLTRPKTAAFVRAWDRCPCRKVSDNLQVFNPYTRTTTVLRWKRK